MKQAFTLVELLVVVLIIGVLTSIAIPMYQGAVDKSHWSTMLPAAKAIKDAEEAIKMTNGEYTDTMEHLDVTMNNENLNFTLDVHNNLSDPNVIRVTNPKLANVRLGNYLDDSPKFAGQLHCEALKTDDRANRLCGKLLSGEELTSADGYTGYLLDQSIDSATCDNAGRVWSNKQTKCYKTEQDRCKANGMSYNNSTGYCGYINAPEGTVINEGAVCTIVYGYGCSNIAVQNGGVCLSYHTGAGGGYPSNCSSSTFSNQSVCVGSPADNSTCTNNSFDNSLCISHHFSGACSGSTFSNDSVCYAGSDVYSGYGCKNVTYNDTSCCCGAASCPDAHRCSQDRCAEIEKQVQKIETGTYGPYRFSE